jgi:spermidine/putrescine transport system permease protein
VKASRLPLVTTVLVLLFLWLPIAVLVVSSFNAARFGGSWEGFSLRWYARLLQEREVWLAVQNSLLIAVAVTLASLVLGTASGFALHRWAGGLQRFHYAMIYSPLVLPDILMGMSLLLLFVSLEVPLGLGTIFLAQTTFSISYVAMVILARLQDFDFTVVEAARDLGAGRWTTIRRILLPLLAPGLAAGGLLAFTLSIDDFVITFFVAGPGATTLPLRIYSMIKHGSPTLLNALSTILLLATFLAALLAHRVTAPRGGGPGESSPPPGSGAGPRVV